MSPTSLPAISDLRAALRHALHGEVRFDASTRSIYATDASMYAIEPLGMVAPRDADEVAAAVEIAGRFGVPVLPRGAGTSLAGQTVGEAVILDLSRHMTDIVAIDPEAARARVQPGVVQDDLNRAVAPHGLLFAPDTSTGNRATLGGMIGNNSCGARSARYGMTIDHVDTLDVVLSDASAARLQERSESEVRRLARAPSLEGALYRTLPPLVRDHADVIRRAMPPHWRRSGGYRLERLLPEAGPLNLARVVVGSEGTLAVVTEATVRLVPRPGGIAAVAAHFASVEEAVEAAPGALEVGAATVELVDAMILDLARSSPLHRHLAERLDGRPAALLWVEFYGGSAAEAEAGVDRLVRRWRGERRGYAHLRAASAEEQEGFRALRRAGLGLLMAAGKGGERSVAFVEDTAVAPEDLAEYTRRFAALLDGFGLRAGFYGHASAGCLHIRPFMDLSRPREPARLRAVAEAVLELVMEFGGMNASEHGDGLARAEFNRRFFGDGFYRLMQEVKRTFDPEGRLNPGKKVDAPPMTEHLRLQALPPAPALRTHFHFSGGMRAAALECQRIGACRKSAEAGGTMCPSYMATRREEDATRGRANALAAALSAPDPRAALAGEELHQVLDLCLECKACRRECPLSVDMATLKAEALAHRNEVHGTPARSLLFGHARTVFRVGSALAPLSNLGGSPPLRMLAERLLGIDRRRPLPRYARESLPRWFARRTGSPGGAGRSGGAAAPNGGVRRAVLLADCFTSYTEPEIGRAAVELLEAAGWTVELVSDVCCGRSFISRGMLNEARDRHRRLLERLVPAARDGVPIVACEPSCIMTLRDEVVQLARGSGRAEDVADAEAVADAARLADDLVAEAVEEGRLRPGAGTRPPPRVVFHPHCHQKAAGAVGGSERLLRALPGAEVEVLDAGCCGMAGAFGYEREHYELSMTIGGQRLFPAIAAADGAVVAATGVSCRQQIAHGTGAAARHPLTLLREATTIP